MSNRSAVSNHQIKGEDKKLHIPRAVFLEMCLHAREERPVEACGYLAGKDTRVKKMFRMRNVDESEEHFMFDPEEQFAVAEKASEAGLTLIAVYHSHPSSPPRPSAEDIRLAYDPEIIHVILSTMAPKPIVKAFRIEEGTPREVPVRIA